jgi:hypothetical protein
MYRCHLIVNILFPDVGVDDTAVSGKAVRLVS